MPEFITNIFSYISVTNPNDMLMLMGLLGVMFIAFVFRIFLSMGYQSQIAIVAMTSKTVKTKEDIGKLKLGAYARMAKDYAALGDKGNAHINARAIVEKEILRLSFAFWNYVGVESFVLSIENAILPLSILLCFGAENRIVFIIAAAGSFVVIRLFAAIFDFGLAKRIYIENTAYILDRELGGFYVTDAATAITGMAEKIETAMKTQANSLSGAVSKIGSDMTDAVKTSMGAMTMHIEGTMNSISTYADTLQKPMENWKTTITESVEAQGRMNQSTDSMNCAISGFASVVGAFASMLGEYKSELNNNSQKIGTQIEGLSVATAKLNEICAGISNRNDVYEEGLKTIKINQAALEGSVQAYETTLKEMTSQMGGALGKILEYHMQESYNSLSRGVSENLEQMSVRNTEFVEKLSSMFEQMREQSKTETSAIISVKEQMDMHFESLKDKIKVKD